MIDTQSKAFHVSPFFNEEGEYQFTIHPLELKLDIGIRYSIKDETVFFANLVGTPRPFSWKTKWLSTIRFPLTIALTMPRILWQAFLLYYKRKLPAKSKPIPHHIHTIRKWRPTMFQKNMPIRCTQII